MILRFILDESAYKVVAFIEHTAGDNVGFMKQEPSSNFTPMGLSALQELMGSRNATCGERFLPSRSIPLPESVSESFRRTIGLPYRDAEWNLDPPDAAGWREAVARQAKIIVPIIEHMCDRHGITVTQSTIENVPVFDVIPSRISKENRSRLVLNLHGGGYVFNPGRAGLLEGVVLAISCGIRVLVVDYRMPPDHPFPAALDDAFAVWSSIVKRYPHDTVAISGASAGGGLAMATILRAQQEGIQCPAALLIQTPWADLTQVGDSFQTNEWLDNVVVSYSAMPVRLAKLYANGHDYADPYLSPLQGDLRLFPPTMLLSGTRDLFLSLTVLTHRKLRRAGVPASLHLIEGASHYQYFINPFADESQDAFAEMTIFINENLSE